MRAAASALSWHVGPNLWYARLTDWHRDRTMAAAPLPSNDGTQPSPPRDVGLNCRMLEARTTSERASSRLHCQSGCEGKAGAVGGPGLSFGAAATLACSGLPSALLVGIRPTRPAEHLTDTGDVEKVRVWTFQQGRSHQRRRPDGRFRPHIPPPARQLTLTSARPRRTNTRRFTRPAAKGCSGRGRRCERRAAERRRPPRRQRRRVLGPSVPAAVYTAGKSEEWWYKFNIIITCTLACG